MVSLSNLFHYCTLVQFDQKQAFTRHVGAASFNFFFFCVMRQFLVFHGSLFFFFSIFTLNLRKCTTLRSRAFARYPLPLLAGS